MKSNDHLTAEQSQFTTNITQNGHSHPGWNNKYICLAWCMLVYIWHVLHVPMPLLGWNNIFLSSSPQYFKNNKAIKYFFNMESEDSTQGIHFCKFYFECFINENSYFQRWYFIYISIHKKLKLVSILLCNEACVISSILKIPLLLSQGGATQVITQSYIFQVYFL